MPYNSQIHFVRQFFPYNFFVRIIHSLQNKNKSCKAIKPDKQSARIIPYNSYNFFTTFGGAGGCENRRLVGVRKLMYIKKKNPPKSERITMKKN